MADLMKGVEIVFHLACLGVRDFSAPALCLLMRIMRSTLPLP